MEVSRATGDRMHAKGLRIPYNLPPGRRGATCRDGEPDGYTSSGGQGDDILRSRSRTTSDNPAGRRIPKMSASRCAPLDRNTPRNTIWIKGSRALRPLGDAERTTPAGAATPTPARGSCPDPQEPPGDERVPRGRDHFLPRIRREARSEHGGSPNGCGSEIDRQAQDVGPHPPEERLKRNPSAPGVEGAASGRM